ncbi:MAG: DUF1015 domain-containing protein [Oscillospiraceae bacterium]|jgi:hypothetical protein|nr:DUF1015 domain-containing protein [Oscillospiraceae bacterium]
MNAESARVISGFDGIGLAPAEILVPAPGVDVTRWAVVACDQFTSQPEYWREAEALVGDSPSTLGMILPEVYLNAPDAPERARRILSNMRLAADSGAALPFFGFALVERRFDEDGHGGSRPARIGLVVAVDLEAYDFAASSTSPIRPTEGTIIERLPPRAAIRREAALELPHILLLLQDKARSVVEPIYNRRGSLRPLYDAPLMLGGGSIKGWAIDDPNDISAIGDALRSLPMADGVRAAVGDGNHSLAAARSVWLETRDTIPQEQRAAHPLRYALAEACNVYDEGITFEPIHRIIYGAGMGEFMEAFAAWTAAQGGTLSGEPSSGRPLVCLSTEGESLFWIAGMKQQTTVGIVQAFLDQWSVLQNRPEVCVDYIHGDDTLRVLASQQPNRVGIMLPALDKSELFPAIARDGALPRKTFSMGHAREKRYYLESRLLR